MTAIQTSHGVHASMSFTSSEIDLMNASFHSAVNGDSSQTVPSPRLNSPGPLPLPSFVFPARSLPSPSSTPSSFSRSPGRRPNSATSPRSNEGFNSLQGDRESLPAFSFGNQNNSPPTSPHSIPPRPGSHKRGTSEYIGGDGQTGAGQLLSTSPTKGDGALPVPASSAAGRRRGHAHRRSAAISCGDLSVILKPNSGFPRGGSAPTSPNSEYPAPLSDSPVLAVQPMSSGTETIEKDDQNPPLKAFKTTRVGFSDDVQIIPRPLSIVSSDSASTVRPGHSVSNSMSSVISTGTHSPQTKEKQLSISRVNARPRTAEPILDRERLADMEHTPKRRGSLPLLIDAVTGSSSLPSTPRSAKRWTFFGHETHSGDSSPKSRPTSASSSVKESKKTDTAVSIPNQSTADIPMQSLERTSSRRSSISRKHGKKQKKVKSWAGSILSRKSRQRSQKQKLSRRSPTPPLRSYTPIDDYSHYDFNLPADTSLHKPDGQPDFTNWKPRKFPPQEESMSPVIDLDAALGPFNTPTSSFGDDWEYSQRGSKPNRKRAMHSAAGLGGFSGPGGHYHRRAESAPEFENPRFGLHRLGSSSTMAMEDVFEEDEDEEWEDTKTTTEKEPSSKTEDVEIEETGLGIDIKVDNSEVFDSAGSMDLDDNSALRGVKRKGSGLSEGDRRQMSSTKSVHSTTSLVEFPIQEEVDSPVEIFDDSIPSRPDSRARSSGSTATPPFGPKPGKELTPVEIQSYSLQPPYPTPTSPRSTTQSSFPSPRSPFSYDTQRISTAPSSITDENAFQSLLLGEPGPELRMSVDDAPSLTSSHSTTREGGFNSVAMNARFRDGQRSASFSSASASAATRKRSSMASLSRLISSSHGEKSKLSIESRAPSHTEGDKKDKAGKGKRLSRMMQFWKKPGDS